MARPGRKPLAERHLESLDGSTLAKRRLEMILRTMRGELTIPEACRALGIGPARFHAMRRQWLEEALALLEPRPVGRPRGANAAASDPDEVASLRQANEGLRRELVAAEVRCEIAAVMPHVLTDAPAPQKKSRSRRRPR